MLAVYLKTSAMAYLVSDAFLVDKASGHEFTLLFLLAGTYATFSFALAFSMWTGYVVALYWQKQLISDLQSVYFKSKVIYAANKMVPSLDNVDQRIADDTRWMTQNFSQIMFGNPLTTGAIQVSESE